MAESQSSCRALRVYNLVEIDVKGSNLLEGGCIILFYVALFGLAAVVLVVVERIDQKIINFSGEVVGVFAADVEFCVV